MYKCIARSDYERDLGYLVFDTCDLHSKFIDTSNQVEGLDAERNEGYYAKLRLLYGDGLFVSYSDILTEVVCDKEGVIKLSSLRGIRPIKLVGSFTLEIDDSVGFISFGKSGIKTSAKLDIRNVTRHDLIYQAYAFCNNCKQVRILDHDWQRDLYYTGACLFCTFTRQRNIPMFTDKSDELFCKCFSEYINSGITSAKQFLSDYVLEMLAQTYDIDCVLDHLDRSLYPLFKYIHAGGQNEVMRGMYESLLNGKSVGGSHGIRYES